MKNKRESGIISIFVLFSMAFLLIFVVTVYFFVQNKIKNREIENLELKKIYSKQEGDAKLNENVLSNEIIPIYNIDELNIAGTGSYLKINNKIYQCGIGMSYILKDNIIVDIDEDIITRRIEFNDYKLYSPTYHIDNFSKDIYYYKESTYWKAIVHKKYNISEKETIIKDNYMKNDFSLINEFDFSKFNNCRFLMLWSNNENKLEYFDIVEQGNKINYLNQIKVFEKNKDKINQKNGEIYIFIDIGNKI